MNSMDEHSYEQVLIMRIFDTKKKWFFSIMDASERAVFAIFSPEVGLIFCCLGRLTSPKANKSKSKK